MAMWLVLGFERGRMGKSCQGFFNVAWHAEVDMPSFIVPVEGEAEVLRALPVHVADVVFAKDIEEMVDVVRVDVFDTKVVNYQAELDRAPVMGPKSGH